MTLFELQSQLFKSKINHEIIYANNKHFLIQIKNEDDLERVNDVLKKLDYKNFVVKIVNYFDSEKRVARSIWAFSNVEEKSAVREICTTFLHQCTLERKNLFFRKFGIYFNNSLASRAEQQLILSSLRKLITRLRKVRQQTIKFACFFRRRSYAERNDLVDIALKEIIDSTIFCALPQNLSNKDFLIYSLKEHYKSLVSSDNVTFSKDLKISAQEKEEYKQKFVKERKEYYSEFLDKINYIEKCFDFQANQFLS